MQTWQTFVLSVTVMLHSKGKAKRIRLLRDSVANTREQLDIYMWARDTLVIPSTCIRERDIVIAPLVRVCVCLSVCLHLIAS